MKRILIIYLLMFLNVISIHCNIWNKIAKASKQGINAIGTAIHDTKNFFNNQLSGCAEVVGLGTAYGSAEAALETANFAVSSSQLIGKKVALDTAQNILEDAKKSSEGILTLADAIAKGIGEGFNITCIRFLGSVEELEFELDAIILGKSVHIRDKVDFNDVKKFTEKILKKLQDEVNKVF